MVQKPEVESEFALVWVCPDCRQQNRVRVMPAELNMEEREECLKHGMEHDELKDVVAVAQAATCARCGKQFRLKHPLRFNLKDHG